MKQTIDGLYLGDLITEGDNISNVKLLKETETQVFKEAGFVLHKWHCNCSKLDETNSSHKSAELNTRSNSGSQNWSDKNIRNQIGIKKRQVCH